MCNIDVLLFTDDITSLWDEENGTVITQPCHHENSCNPIHVSIFTAVKGIQKSFLPKEILNVFRLSFCNVLTMARFNNCEYTIMHSPALWPETTAIKMWKPNLVTVLDPKLIRSEFVGFMPDGIFKIFKSDNVADYDGISLPKEIPVDRSSLFVNEYFKNIILSMRPYGTEKHKRENLKRLRVTELAPYSLALGNHLLKH